jgi:hypothetical protein
MARSKSINKKIMTDQEFKKHLEQLNVPDIQASKQAQVLKLALLSQHKARFWLTSVFLNAIYSYKQMSTFKKFSPVLAALIIAITVGALHQFPTASAQATVNKAMMRAEKLSPEQKATIEAKIKADLNQSLEEAKAAPDLKIETDNTSAFGKITAPFGKVKKALTFKHKADGTEPAGEAAFGIAMSGGPDQAILGNIKTMTYTNPKGQKVTLGVDENDMVVFKMMELSEEDKQQLIERSKLITPGEMGEKKFHSEGGTEERFEFSMPPIDVLTVPDNQ